NPRTWLLVTAFVQGTAVARNAAANPAPTAGRGTRPTRPGCSSFSSGTSGPSTRPRHSGPTTPPRTGTAQAMHTGRPHSSQVATAGLPGWTEHRPATRDVFSPEGTGALYDRPLGRDRGRPGGRRGRRFG